MSRVATNGRETSSSLEQFLGRIVGHVFEMLCETHFGVKQKCKMRDRKLKKIRICNWMSRVATNGREPGTKMTRPASPTTCTSSRPAWFSFLQKAC